MPTYSINDLGKVTSQSLPEIEVFKHINFNFATDTTGLQPGEKEYHASEDKLKGGELSFRTTFNVDLTGHSLDKNISSVIVHSGYWQFFSNDGGSETAFPPVLGPGHYARVTDIGIPNDRISSFKCIGFKNPPKKKL